MIVDKDNSTDKWECPFCGCHSAYIIENTVLLNVWEELLCNCTRCDGLYIRRYQFVETIKLVRQATNEPEKVKRILLIPVENKEVGKRYFWNRPERGGKKGNVTIVSEGTSDRYKGWHVKYGNEDYTTFADDKELFEEIHI